MAKDRHPLDLKSVTTFKGVELECPHPVLVEQGDISGRGGPIRNLAFCQHFELQPESN